MPLSLPMMAFSYQFYMGFVLSTNTSLGLGLKFRKTGLTVFFSQGPEDEEKETTLFPYNCIFYLIFKQGSEMNRSGLLL